VSAKVVAIVVGLAIAGSAQATVWITQKAVKPALRVDAGGTAEVSWGAGGRQTVIVPPKGQLSHGGTLSGSDVSKPARVPGLPLARVVRRTPDGRFWALQEIALKPGAPLDLHLARWRGAPTVLTLGVAEDTLEGRATFHGRGLSGRSYTLEGKHPLIYVYLDYFAAGAWHRMLGIAPTQDGRFAVTLRPVWQAASRYRASMIGPNIGSTFAPDAEATIAAP
jgi:hypothetical protein